MNKFLILSFIIIGILITYFIYNYNENPRKENSLNSVEEDKINLLLDTLFKNGEIYSYVKSAEERGFYIIRSNKLIVPFKEYYNHIGKKFLSLDNDYINMNNLIGGILEFREIHFTKDSSQVDVKLLFLGEENLPYRTIQISYKFNFDKSKWEIHKSEVSRH